MSLLNLFGDDADFFTGKTPESRARGVGQIAYESIPGISEAVTFRDIKNELSKKNPIAKELRTKKFKSKVVKPKKGKGSFRRKKR